MLNSGDSSSSSFSLNIENFCSISSSSFLSRLRMIQSIFEDIYSFDGISADEFWLEYFSCSSEESLS